MRPSQARPARLVTVSAGRGGSTISASGRRIRPPAVNCQAVKLRAETGGCHFRLSTVPAAIDAAPPRPAAMPMGSSAAPGPISSNATPAIPAAAAATAPARIAVPSQPRAMKMTIIAWSAPKVAATPPGSR